jgi:FKBP-type peptidyl-prolyl cis-trans isomerase FkpA
MNSFYTYFKKLAALFLTGLLLLYSGCFSDDEKDAAVRLTEDLARIDQYLADHGIEALQDSSRKVRYVIHKAGTGEAPTLDSCVTLKYTGKFLEDETVFTSSTESSYPMAGDLIEGWKLGLPMLREGDDATLYIPSGLAYGPSGLPLQNIPPNTIVYFELTLSHVGTHYTSTPTPTPTSSCK